MVNRQLQTQGLLKIHSAVLLTTVEDFLKNSATGKYKDYTLYYVHGVIVYDIPYAEHYLLSTALEFTITDEQLKANDLKIVPRNQLMTLQEVAKLRRDDHMYKQMVRRAALLSELTSMTKTDKTDN